MAEYILAIDQGTTSTRAIVFNHDAQIVSNGQLSHQQIFARPGWVEHDALEIWDRVRETVGIALSRADLTHLDITAVGVTNQRETTIIWDRRTGRPITNAIVWQDIRTQDLIDDLAGTAGPDRFKQITGLPLATYFSAPKIAWILNNIEGARDDAERGDLLFGTMDSWLIWNLTGGVHGGCHVTDVTNASRTMLMDLDTLTWRDDIAEEFGIPMSMLPTIRSSSEVIAACHPRSLLDGVPIAGILGDQQAATFGQACFAPGTAKNTYGTGNFLLMNTGATRVSSSNGLLTTVAYRIGDAGAVYALEGSIAVTGSLVQWLRDNLGLFDKTSDIERLARDVDDNGGAYIVPAFSGLFAPYWRPDARGVVVGLTRYIRKEHIARAALEAAAYQTRDVVEAMNLESQVPLTELRVDGGMVSNEILMQFQADQLGVDVVRPRVTETTALGAAYAAGIAVRYWSGIDEVRDAWSEGARWHCQMSSADSSRLYADWRRAVDRSMNWVSAD